MLMLLIGHDYKCVLQSISHIIHTHYTQIYSVIQLQACSPKCFILTKHNHVDAHMMMYDNLVQVNSQCIER